jgi:hypothetical protein
MVGLDPAISTPHQSANDAAPVSNHSASHQRAPLSFQHRRQPTHAAKQRIEFRFVLIFRH